MLDPGVYGETVIRDFLETMRDALVAYMDAEDRNASGRSKQSLQVVNVTGSTGQLIGAEWIQYVFKGRGPGKMPPLDRIADWCSDRGIARSMAWVIAKQIADFGTKLWRERRNIFDEIISEEVVNAFIDSIAKIYAARLRTEINAIFYTAE